MDQQQREAREALRVETRAQLRRALETHAPKAARVLVFGSLTMPGRFNQYSDIDLALLDPCDDRVVQRLAAALEEELHRRVDVVVLEQSRLKEKIVRTGEVWTLSA